MMSSDDYADGGPSKLPSFRHYYYVPLHGRRCGGLSDSEVLGKFGSTNVSTI